jgi:5-methylthioadenosine/S-adenosylhomocysteine deaminase
MIRICRFLAVSALLALTAYAQQSADWIWSARYVITMDAGWRVIENGAVAISGNKILAVGARAEIDRAYKPKQRLDRPNALIAPGLIDTHTHAPMSLLRGIADDKRLQDWLENYIFPAEARNVDAEFVRWGTRLACLEMARYGTTTYTDMYYFEDVIAETTREAGLRGVLGQTIIGFPAPDYKTTDAALRGTERYLERFKDDDLIVPVPAPHSVYTVPEEVLKASRALAAKYNAPLLIHLSETKRENEDNIAKRGMSPTQWLDSLGVLNGRTLGAHGVWLDDKDLGILAQRHTGLAHCPTSNTKLASGIARVIDIQKRGINMGLGTDGFAGSNNSADLVQEMALASKLQKVTRMDPEVLPARDALAMATIVGARALGMEDRIGSLEPGKLADMIAVSLEGSNGVPIYDIYSAFVYALKATDVSDVMVNGRAIVRDGRITTLNAAEIRAKAADYRRRISESLKRR